jgi:Peptidase propeptide and YPEB domain
MKRRYIWVAGGALAAAVAVGLGAGAAQAGPGETEVPITGDALARASAAALAHTGGGTVTGTEVGDEEGYYEIEVTRADGSRLDVHLSAEFTVLGSLADHE